MQLKLPALANRLELTAQREKPTNMLVGDPWHFRRLVHLRLSRRAYPVRHRNFLDLQPDRVSTRIKLPPETLLQHTDLPLENP